MNVQAALSDRAAAVPPGSPRQILLLAAKRFKASWAELGKLLVEVRDQALFEQWGFDTLEAYCQKELHLKKATVEKLVRSFSFLARHEPQRVKAEDFGERAPAFEVIEVLAEAEQRGQISADDYQQVRDAIWRPDKPTSELRRELTERFPRPPAAPPPDPIRLRRFALSARRLANELAAGPVSPALADRAGALAAELERLSEGRQGG